MDQFKLNFILTIHWETSRNAQAVQTNVESRVTEIERVCKWTGSNINSSIAPDEQYRLETIV